MWSYHIASSSLCITQCHQDLPTGSQHRSGLQWSPQNKKQEIVLLTKQTLTVIFFCFEKYLLKYNALIWKSFKASSQKSFSYRGHMENSKYFQFWIYDTNYIFKQCYDRNLSYFVTANCTRAKATGGKTCQSSKDGTATKQPSNMYTQALWRINSASWDC